MPADPVQPEPTPDPLLRLPCNCDNDGWYVHDDDCPRGIAWEARAASQERPPCRGSCSDLSEEHYHPSQERPPIDVERDRLIEALRDEQHYAGALSDALLRMGHHPFGHHESPTQYDGDSPRACSFAQCLSRLSGSEIPPQNFTGETQDNEGAERLEGS